MPSEISQSFTFNSGLQSILTADNTSEAVLPQSMPISPTDEGMEVQLQNFMQSPHFDQRILAFIRPMLSNREILLPGKFDSLAGETAEFLEGEAAAEGDSEKAETLRSAAQLLRQNKELRDLLQSFRHALHKA